MKRLAPVLFIVLLAYIVLGFYPLVAVEGDDLAVANAAQMQMTGQIGIDVGYQAKNLRGTYVLLKVFSKMTGQNILTVYGALTALACVAFIFVAATFIARLTKRPWAECGLVLLLFQEVYVSGYYANSNMLAAPFILSSALLASYAQRYLNLLAALILAIAIWIRIDAVLLAPAILFIAIAWGKISRDDVPLAAGTFLLLLLFSMGNPAFLLNMSNEYQIHHRNGFLHWTLAQQSLASVFTWLISFSLCLGVFASRIKPEERRILFLVLLAFVPIAAAYFPTYTTPKYFLYAIPFLALLALQGLRYLTQQKGWFRVVLTAAAVFCFCAQYILPRANSVFYSHDGARFISSISIAPLFWRGLKEGYLYRETLMNSKMSSLGSGKRVGFVIEDWIILEQIKWLALKQGYQLDSKRTKTQNFPHNLTLKKKNASISTWALSTKDELTADQVKNFHEFDLVVTHFKSPVSSWPKWEVELTKYGCKPTTESLSLFAPRQAGCEEFKLY